MLRGLLNEDTVTGRDMKTLSQLSIWAITERKLTKESISVLEKQLVASSNKKTQVFDSMPRSTGSHLMPPFCLLALTLHSSLLNLTKTWFSRYDFFSHLYL